MSRREIIGNLAAATALPALPPSSTFPPVEFSARDADLLELFEEWERSAAVNDQAEERLYLLYKDYEEMPPPKALFRQSSDFGIFFGFLGREYRDSGRWWYGGDLDYVSNYEAPSHFSDDAKARTSARIHEITMAGKAWAAANRAKRSAVGLEDAEVKADKLAQENRALRCRILAKPARSLDGLLAKARVYTWCNRDAAEDLAADLQDKLQAEAATDEACLDSIALDLVRMLQSEHSDAD